jgi:hypothetical protein
MKFSSLKLRFFIHQPALMSLPVLVLLSAASPVSAHVRVVHAPYHYLVQRETRHAQTSNFAVRHPESEPAAGYHPGGTVTVSTAAGPITVAADAADKFVSLTNDLVAHGFHGSVNCAATGHMPNSLHHTGHACDFAQTARNRTVGVMYHVSDIIAAHGLRDGCSFGDCGHVDTGAPIGATRLASASRRDQAEAANQYQSPASRYQTEAANRNQSQSYGSEGRRRGRTAVASWYGGNNMPSFTPAKESPRSYAQETGHSVYMRIANHDAFAHERFVEVSHDSAHAFALAHHGVVRVTSPEGRGRRERSELSGEGRSDSR